MKKNPKSRKCIVFTAPSGAGKTTIVRHLLSKFDFLGFSVSATNRSKRVHEKEGVDYYFLSDETFRNKVENGEFIEWEEVYEGQYYGTLYSEIDRVWEENKHIVFDIDVRGAVNIKEKYGDQCYAIFIKAPSIEELMRRLKKRKTETEKTLAKRINRAKGEMEFENRFDEVLINDDLDVALLAAENLVTSFIHNKEEEE